jgi:hypothetical protein
MHARAGRRARVRVLLLSSAAGIAYAPLAAVALAPTMTVATPAAIRFHHATRITGALTDEGVPRAGAVAQLQQNPYPYKGFVDAAHTTTASDGLFVFDNVRPDRNTRFRVVEPGRPSVVTSEVAVSVAVLGQLRSRKLGPGRVHLSLVIRHSGHFRWRGERVFWYLRRQGSRVFKPAVRTHARERRRGTTTAVATVTPPARRFSVRACLEPADLAGVGPQPAARRCPRRSCKPGKRPSGLAFEAKGRGELAYPSLAAIASARRWFARRSGRTGFAVVDSAGRLYGVRMNRQFASASVVKAMLLVAFLRRLAGRHAGLDAGARSRLYPMIHVSDNGAASAIFGVVGQGGLVALAHRAGMTHFSPSGIWGGTMITAADQARFFFRQDKLIPPRFRRYARGLLSGIAREQSWGVPAAARRRGYRVFFKGGWNPARGRVHQAARLERDGRKIAIAVLQDNVGMGYGEATIAGITRRLLRR